MANPSLQRDGIWKQSDLPPPVSMRAKESFPCKNMVNHMFLQGVESFISIDSFQDFKRQ